MPFGDYISLLSFNDAILAKAEGYSESERYSFIIGKNINYFIYHYGFLLLASIAAFYVVKKDRNYNHLMKLEPYLFLGILFYILSAIIVIFSVSSISMSFILFCLSLKLYVFVKIQTIMQDNQP